MVRDSSTLNPLSFDIIEDAVKLPHSPQVFERGPLVEWLARDHSCPMTRLPSEVSDIVEAAVKLLREHADAEEAWDGPKFVP